MEPHWTCIRVTLKTPLQLRKRSKFHIRQHSLDELCTTTKVYTLLCASVTHVLLLCLPNH